MTYQILGSCSICGGRVVIPMVFHSVTPPVGKCISCGAVEAHGPVEPIIQMRPPAPKSHKPTPGSTADVPFKENSNTTGKKLLNG